MARLKASYFNAYFTFEVRGKLPSEDKPKIAVVGSALFGMISGSAVSNVLAVGIVIGL